MTGTISENYFKRVAKPSIINFWLGNGERMYPAKGE